MTTDKETIVERESADNMLRERGYNNCDQRLTKYDYLRLAMVVAVGIDATFGWCFFWAYLLWFVF